LEKLSEFISLQQVPLCKVEKIKKGLAEVG
jgi:hypothetical protein